MIRLLGFIAGLWLLVTFHAPYQERAVAKAMTGQEILNGTGGLVSVTGVVNTVENNTAGGLTIRMDAQGALVTVYSDTQHRPVPPDAGQSVSVTGRRMSRGLIVLEDGKALKTIPVLAQAAAGRVTLAVSRVAVIGHTQSGRYTKVALFEEGGPRMNTGLVPAALADRLSREARGITTVRGYQTPGKRFVIESWQ